MRAYREFAFLHFANDLNARPQGLRFLFSDFSCKASSCPDQKCATSLQGFRRTGPMPRTPWGVTEGIQYSAIYLDTVISLVIIR